jgi:hypothetical protein
VNIIQVVSSSFSNNFHVIHKNKSALSLLILN